MNMGGAPSLLRNDLKNDNRWLKVELQGTKSNRSAIGATVQVEAGKWKLTDVVLSQSSYISHNDARLHFGLGTETAATRITVRWPNGAVEIFPGAPACRLVRLVEGSGQTQTVTMPK
jgi:enediyne biosynthesis protein E4